MATAHALCSGRDRSAKQDPGGGVMALTTSLAVSLAVGFTVGLTIGLAITSTFLSTRSSPPSPLASSLFWEGWGEDIPVLVLQY